MALAGQLAYFFVLFLLPFLLFLVSLAGLTVDDPEPLLEGVFAKAADFLPRAGIEVLRSHLGPTLRSSASSTLLISGLLTLAAGRASTEAIIIAANRFYGVPETRPFWKRWGISALLTSGFTLLVATMAFLVLGPQTGHYLQRMIGLPKALADLWGPLSWVIASFNLVLAFDILYYLAPDVHLPFRWITPGALMTLVLLLISNKIFIFWASTIFRSRELYGRLGIGIVLLIWLYTMGLVLLAGMEVNAELDRVDEDPGNARPSNR
jgi:membrane protein